MTGRREKPRKQKFKEGGNQEGIKKQESKMLFDSHFAFEQTSQQKIKLRLKTQAYFN